MFDNLCFFSKIYVEKITYSLLNLKHKTILKLLLFKKNEFSAQGLECYVCSSDKIEECSTHHTIEEFPFALCPSNFSSCYTQIQSKFQLLSLNIFLSLSYFQTKSQFNHSIIIRYFILRKYLFKTKCFSLQIISLYAAVYLNANKHIVAQIPVLRVVQINVIQIFFQKIA